MELLTDVEIVEEKRLKNLFQEAEELTAILVTCVKTAKQKPKRKS